jgi:CBS domain containing-hemolysin-like protein
VLIVLLAPLLVLTRSVTRLISHGGRAEVSRAEVTALVSLASRQGALRDQESKVLSNVLRLQAVTVSDVMTPRTVVAMLPVSATIGDFLENEAVVPYSRVPVFEGPGDNVAGYVLQREVLRCAASGEVAEKPLAELVRPLRYVPETAKLGNVLRDLLERREHMAVASDEFGATAGIVTLEDLIETILGVEIVDEFDSVVDLRVVAKQIRDERLRRNQRRLKTAPDTPRLD